MFRAPLLTLISLIIFFTVPQDAPAQKWSEPSMAGRSTVYAPHGLVATSQPLASSAGLSILEDGGNAIDAAVGAAAVLSVVEPMMTGIGGDMFAILWVAEEERLVGLNASGWSGSRMTREAFRTEGLDEIPGHGPLTVTVPGALAGWQALLKRHGTLSLGQVLQPAIRLAEQGFPVSPRIAEFWETAEEKLAEHETSRQTFLLEGTRAPKPGEWFRNRDYAEVLRVLAREGPQVFYQGELANRLVSHVEELGGFLTAEDMSSFSPLWVDPISASYKAYELWELPPNGQGIAALEMLKILEPFDLASMGHNSSQYLHYLIEAKKLAFADLAHYVGDRRHMEISPTRLLDPGFLKLRRNEIGTRAGRHEEPGDALTKSETTYLSIADEKGNMISFINSVAATFGSGVVVPGTGFVLQNRGSGFTLEAGLANTVAPRKRPFHTIIPAFVTRRNEEGKQVPWLSYGVMGGSMQPQGHVQVLLNLLEFDMDLQEALDAPRFRHLEGLEVALEPAIPEIVRRHLAVRGHEIVDPKEVFFGGGQAVMRLDRGWAGASDPRMDGMATGY